MEHRFDIEIYTPPSSMNETEVKSALQKAINALRSEAQFGILESLTDIRFPSPTAAEISLEKWPKGRLFSPTFELRWEKNGNGYWAVFVKESDFEPPEAVSACQTEKDSEIKEQFWGRQDNELYLWPENDPRLGRRLSYECLKNQQRENKQNVKLQICQYYDDHGRLIFWRYKTMRWEDESL